jgi:hypothetical protein
MRKAKKKARKGSERPPKSPKVPSNQIDLGVVREQITNLVGNRAVNMVENTIDEVDKGHYLAMKYLFEMVGLCPATTPEEALQEDSLARTLLRRLRLPEETEAPAEVTDARAENPVEQVTDAVE